LIGTGVLGMENLIFWQHEEVLIYEWSRRERVLA
jgi:hypothetical protein